MSSFMQTLNSSVTSPIEIAHGLRCWEGMVRSCHESKTWEDETEDATEESTADLLDAAIEAAMIATPEAEAPADTASGVKTVVPSAYNEFFDSVYESFDWAEEADACPLSPVVSVGSNDSIDSRFFPGRFMLTISEEDEEGYEDKLEEVVDSAASSPSLTFSEPPTPSFEEVKELFDCPSQVEIVVNLPKVVKRVPRSEPIPFTTPRPLAPLDITSIPMWTYETLFDLPRVDVLRRLGLPSDAISRRREVKVRLPPFIRPSATAVGC